MKWHDDGTATNAIRRCANANRGLNFRRQEPGGQSSIAPLPCGVLVWRCLARTARPAADVNLPVVGCWLERQQHERIIVYLLGIFLAIRELSMINASFYAMINNEAVFALARRQAGSPAGARL